MTLCRPGPPPLGLLFQVKEVTPSRRLGRSFTRRLSLKDGGPTTVHPPGVLYDPRVEPWVSRSFARITCLDSHSFRVPLSFLSVLVSSVDSEVVPLWTLPFFSSLRPSAPLFCPVFVPEGTGTKEGQRVQT